MTVTILKGDCREVLRGLPDGSVHCVVTSPPYFGLRDYGTAQWGGGDFNCDHLMPPNGVRNKGRDRAASGGKFHDSPIPNQIRKQFARTCDKCGAARIDNQIGLEATPEAFVDELVAVFREVRRVLRKDATVWLNLGDSYAGYHGNKNAEIPTSAVNGWTNGTNENLRTSTANRGGIKAKDLLGIPWRVAFALQADGWYLRQDIIWSKPNPMPESVRDRCTKAHEYLFLLSKSERYYFDAISIAEPAIAGFNGSSFTSDYDRATKAGLGSVERIDRDTRNKRSVWEVATAPFGDAHFATFPPALIEPCILAGCPEKCCAKCGAPHERIASRMADQPTVAPSTLDRFGTGDAGVHRKVGGQYQKWLDTHPKITTGWRPTCHCGAATTCGTVLDPFFGAGTTGLVADRLGRNCLGIELNGDYADMARRRIAGDSPLFAEVI